MLRHEFWRYTVYFGLLFLQACEVTQRTLPTVNSAPTLTLPVSNDWRAQVGSTKILSKPRSLDVLASYGRAQGLSEPMSHVQDGQQAFSLNLTDVDIRQLSAQVLGEMLHVGYTVSATIHGVVTVRTAAPLSGEQLLRLLESLLSENGAAITKQGGLYHVVPAGVAGGLTTELGIAGTTIISLRYANSDEVVKSLQQYVQSGTRITSAPYANAVVLSGEAPQRDALEELVKSFDVDTLAGQSYALLRVQSASDTASIAEALSHALLADAGQALANMIRILPLPHANAILVVSREPKYITDARRVLSILELSQDRSKRNWHIYYLQSKSATNASYLLQEAFTPNNVTSVPAAHVNSPTMNPDTSNLSTNFGGSSGSPFSGSSDGSAAGLATHGSSSTNATGALNSPVSSNPLLGGITNAGSSGDSDTIRILPDPDDNALLTYATDDEENMIDAMLRRIDNFPLQVRIDATIAEVTLNNNLAYGTQFFFRHHSLTGGLIQSAAQDSSLGAGPYSAAALPMPGSTIPNFVLNASGNDGDLILQALQAVTSVRVLSAPQLLVLDNETAQLQVGNEVPVQNGSLTTTGNTAGILSSTSYMKTGVITQITPRVTPGGLVTLDIQQEVSSVLPQSEVSGQSGSAIGSPSFANRSVKSRIAVQNNQTVGLAGLITDTDSISHAGIPILKDIPILGAAFGTKSTQRTRTELIILLTPHILRSQEDIRVLSGDLQEHLNHAAVVPYQLTPPANLR